MLAALLLAAEEAAEPSKTPFYILAGALVAFALILGVVGTARHETFPPSRGVPTRASSGSARCWSRARWSPRSSPGNAQLTPAPPQWGQET